MNDVSLKEFVERGLEHEREQRELQVQQMADALVLARDTLNARLEGMNELREQINREHGMFTSRELCDSQMEIIETRVRALESFKSNIEGRFVAMAGIIVFIQVALALAGYFWLHK